MKFRRLFTAAGKPVAVYFCIGMVLTDRVTAAPANATGTRLKWLIEIPVVSFEVTSSGVKTSSKLLANQSERLTDPPENNFF